MEVNLRHFDEADCAFVERVFGGEAGFLIPEFNMLEHDGLYFEMFAVDVGLELAGYASLYGVKDDKTAVSLGIEIVTEYRAKGVGAKACDILLDKATQMGYLKAIAQARQNNMASISLIKKKGFIFVGESVSKMGDKLCNFEKSLICASVHNMRLQFAPFEAIKAGSKTVEIRLNDQKRKAVRTGDIIVFLKVDGTEQIAVKVLARHECKSFRELYEKFSALACGSKYDNIEQRLAETYANYYTKEQEAKHGVLGIEIEILPDYKT